MHLNLSPSTNPSYAGQFLKTRVGLLVEAMENGETATSGGFAMAIPGTEAAKSGQFEVFTDPGSGNKVDLRAYDTNGDGLIGVREGGSLIMDTFRSANSEDKEDRHLMRTFGSIEELQEYLDGKFKDVFSVSETEAIYRGADTDGDGEVSEKEARAQMEKIEKEAKRRSDESEKEGTITTSSQAEAISSDESLKSSLKEFRQH